MPGKTFAAGVPLHLLQQKLYTSFRQNATRKRKKQMLSHLLFFSGGAGGI
jgi:hypothetical protein